MISARNDAEHHSSAKEMTARTHQATVPIKKPGAALAVLSLFETGGRWNFTTDQPSFFCLDGRIENRV